MKPIHSTISADAFLLFGGATAPAQPCDQPHVALAEVLDVRVSTNLRPTLWQP